MPVWGGRSSNYEMLRLLAMLAIILYHITFHCITGQISAIREDGQLYFNRPVFYKSLFVLEIANTFGSLGNAIFILLSGYFTCAAGKTLNLVGTAKKLLTQLAFSCVILVIASQIVRQLMLDEYVYALDSGIFNSGSWFVGYYFLIIVIATLFLNRFLEKRNQKEYICFLVVVFSLTQFIWSGGVLDGTIGSGRLLGTGIFLYALGGYLRKYNPLQRIRTWVFPVTILAMYAFVFLSYYNVVMRGIDDYYKKGAAFTQPLPVYGNMDIVIMILTVALFEWFGRMPRFQSRCINFLSAATFMVYLIHDNSFFYNLWGRQDWVELLYLHRGTFLVNYLGWGLGCMAIGTMAYVVYVWIGKIGKRCQGIFVRKDSSSQLPCS